MLDLERHQAPFHIALPYGLSVAVEPLTTAAIAASQAAARRAVEAIEGHARERTKAGLAWTGCPTSRQRASATASMSAQLIRKLAVRHITNWTGVRLEVRPAPQGPLPLALPRARRARVLGGLRR